MNYWPVLPTSDSGRDFTRLQADTYADDRLPTIQGALNVNRGGTNNGVNEWALTSYLSRLTYNYKGKYLFTAAIRSDGSSRFGANNQCGTFPSASVGWVMSDEDFMKPIQPGILCENPSQLWCHW